MCRINDATGWCEGCFRRLEEISAWRSLSVAEQREVLARVARRRDSSLALCVDERPARAE
ncbi:MAG: DUF1289 domain-containing protein [Burkholderiaceae bacterium]|nr:DUF1289 domain-containing protein [Burkholderiaceae bacterium]